MAEASSFMRLGLRVLVAALFLNLLLSFDNWWPTPGIKPDSRLAPEFVYVWVLLLAIVAWRGRVTRGLLLALACSYVLLCIGRYFDMTVPTMFGRPVSLYWDGQQIPRFLWVSAKGSPWWLSVVVVLTVLALLWAIYAAVRASLNTLATHAAPRALRSPTALWVTAAMTLASLANLAGWEASWPYISRPVLPTYLRQTQLLVDTFLPGRRDNILPPSPAFNSGVAGLRGADVKLIMLESYGAIAFDHPQAEAALSASRLELLEAVQRKGQKIVTAYVSSPTFAGGSELAHLSLLSGIDLSDTRRHDVLLTTERPTLVSFMRSKGYHTVGLYPSLSWDWDEKRFYAFDRFLDARDLDYRGPKLGYWSIPDQVALARAEKLAPALADAPPRFMFFPSITSHMPFHPIPPVQRETKRLLDEQPFDTADVQRALDEPVDWVNMLPNYLRMIDYNHRWLAAHLNEPRTRSELLILVGDHQPVAHVSGKGATWEVPVHVISDDQALIDGFIAQGFVPGLVPKRPALGGMHQLTSMLLKAFDAPPADASAANAALTAKAVP
jgi:Sulfatase